MSEETLGRHNNSNDDDDGGTQKHYCTLCFQFIKDFFILSQAPGNGTNYSEPIF